MGSSVDVVRGAYDALAKGDVPGMLSLMDEKIDWQEPVSLPYEDQVGPQAIAENILSRVIADFPNFSLNPREFHDAGEVVLVLGTYRGTSSSTGNELEAEYAHVWRVKDGKLAAFRTYTDTHQWLQAFGKA